MKTPRLISLLAEPANLITIETNLAREYYPLSHAQERMFIAYQLSANGNLYNVPLKIRISGDLDRERLGLSLEALVQRHAILRASFSLQNGQVVQRILPTIEVRKEFQKASHPELDSLFNDFVKPFDLLRDVLIRAKLLKIKNEEHYLLLDFPHLIFDGASIQPLVHDLAQLYAANPPAALAIQFSDFAIWQREGAGLELNHANSNYWQDKFAAFELEPLNLALDFLRPLVPDYHGDSIYLNIEDALFQQLTTIAENKQVSLYSLCLYALTVLLHKYSGQQNLIVGTAVSGRTHDSLDGLVGMFVNTLPVAVTFNETQSNFEALQNLQSCVLAMLEHQDFQIEQLLDQLKLSSAGGRHPLFDVIFNFLEDYQQPLAVNNLNWQVLPWQEGRIAKFDLTVTCNKLTNGIQVEFTYATSLFRAESIQRMAGHYLAILNELAFAPIWDKKVAQLNLLAKAEKQQLLVDFNATHTAFSRESSVLDLFEEVVRLYPAHSAVGAINGELSYQELNRRAERLGAFLIANGVMSDQLVGIIVDNRIEMIIGVLAVLKAGAAYVPMAYDTPLERVSYILEDSRAKVLLSLPGLVDGLVSSAKVIYIDAELPQLNYLRPQIRANNLVYAIYTSGTSGLPKGTLLENRGVVNYVTFLIRDNQLGPHSVGSKFAGFGFDASVIEIYPLLLSGGKLCLIPDQDKFDSVKVNQFFQLNKISYAFLPTQFAELFMELENSSLENLIVGGDKLRKVSQKPYRVKNAYGPTEITVQSHQFIIDAANYANIPIGKPIANSSCYVVDKQLNLVPVGVVGELLIGGDGLARGYLNRDELTAEKFIPNPFQSAAELAGNLNARVYKTGDLVRWLADGNLEFVGRNDFQVKIRGYRIELGEIENRLLQINGIAQTLVVAYQDKNNNSYLCAYYSGTKVGEDLLNQHLSANLASYMIPDYFIWLEKFPINVNGKIERRLLPLPDLAKLSSEYLAPSCREEQLICDEFAAALGLERVGVNDDFYRLGGDSIKTIWLVAKLQADFKINVADVYRYKTPAALAKQVIFVKDNLKQKLEQIKQRYLQSDASASLRAELLAKQAAYRKSVAEFSFIPAKRKIRSVLLTGATGYLGCNLLYQLLNQTDYRLVLLIRAKDDRQAFDRVRAKFKFYYDQELSDYRNRVTAYAADIQAHQLSLESKTYLEISQQIDSIIHAAALVKHYGEYSEFYQANVKATLNLLDLVKLTRAKDFHYVSTYSVLEDGHIPGHTQFMFSENDDADNLLARTNVYVQTKYEGEVVVRAARAAGINGNIYRVGNLSMQSTNFRNQENIEENGFYLRVKAMLNLGMIASEVATFEVSPVDFTALAIVKIFDQLNLNNNTYHVYNPQVCSLAPLLAADQSLNVRQVTISEFIDQMLAKLNLSSYRQHIEMFMLHQGWLQEPDDNPGLQTFLLQEQTNKILQMLGVSWPAIDLEMITDLIAKAYASRVELIKGTFLRDDLADSEVLNLAKCASLRHHKQHQLILKQGEVNANLILIAEGFVDNYIKSPGGWISSLQLLSAGDVLNLEVTAKLANTSSYEVVFDDVTTVEISKEYFLQQLVDKPQLYAAVIKKLFADKDILQQMYACLK